MLSQEQLFYKNLSFFKEKYPAIYEQIKGLSLDIDIDDELVNFLDNQASKNSKQLSLSIQNSISLIQTKKIEFKKIFDYKIDSYKFINQFIEKIDFNNLKLQNIKVAIFGLNLGFDLNYLSKNKYIKAILVLEDDINLIFLSLFFIKYHKIKQKIFFNDIDSFLDYKYNLNHFIKHINNDKLYFNRFLEYFDIHNILNYTFSEYLGAYKQSLINLNKYKLLDLKKSHLPKPILFLGAGKSLDDNLKNIKKYKSSFFIVAIGSILKILERNNILPDLIINIDGTTKVIEQFKLKKEFFKIPAIFSAETKTKAIKKFKQSYLIQTNLDIANYIVFSGHTIADVGLEILFYLSDDIYMLGFDFGGDYADGYIGRGGENFIQAKYFFNSKLKKYPNKNLYNLSYNDILPKIDFNDIGIKKIDKNYMLFGKKIKIEQERFFLNEIIKKYDKLLSPYIELSNDKKLQKKQLKKIEQYFFKN